MTETTNHTRRHHRGDHGVPFGILWAALICLTTLGIIGLSVADNSRAPVSSGLTSR